MELLRINSVGEGLWKIECDSEQKSILNFLWKGFIRASNENHVNYKNEEKIKTLVKDKTREINEDNIRLSKDITNQRNKLMSNDSLIDNMKKEINYLRDSKAKDISDSIEQCREQCMNNTKEFINCLQGQILDYKNQLSELIKDKLSIESKLSKLTEVITDKVTSSSYDKGVEGEDNLLYILQDSGEFIVEDTHTDNHKGDAVIRRNKKTYCIDSKNHSRNVPSEDVSKLIHDIELNNYDGGAIIAWNAPIYDPVAKAKIKQQISYKMISSKPILFISRAKEISKEAIISLLINLEDHISKDSIETSKNYDKLKDKMINIAKNELKRVDTIHNSLQRQLGANKKERHYWREVLKDCDNDTPPEIKEESNCISMIDLFKEVAKKSTEQRNSSKDIINYLINYSKYHKHHLLKECESLKKDKLNDMLIELNYINEKKRGKNHEGKIRDNKSPTWDIYLPNIGDNNTLN